MIADIYFLKPSTFNTVINQIFKLFIINSLMPQLSNKLNTDPLERSRNSLVILDFFPQIHFQLFSASSITRMIVSSILSFSLGSVNASHQVKIRLGSRQWLAYFSAYPCSAPSDLRKYLRLQLSRPSYL